LRGFVLIRALVGFTLFSVPLATTHTNAKRESKDHVARSFTLRALGRVIPAALYFL
jgi:hypothetical protein